MSGLSQTATRAILAITAIFEAIVALVVIYYLGDRRKREAGR